MDAHTMTAETGVETQFGGQTATPGAKRRTEALDYLQSMLGQMRTMAESERCDMLAYLIEMAYIEASDIIRGQRPARVAMPKRDAA